MFQGLHVYNAIQKPVAPVYHPCDIITTLLPSDNCWFYSGWQFLHCFHKDCFFVLQSMFTFPRFLVFILVHKNVHQNRDVRSDTFKYMSLAPDVFVIRVHYSKTSSRFY